MDNQVVFVLLGLGVILVGLAHELGGIVGRGLNAVGMVLGLVAVIGVLVR